MNDFDRDNAWQRRIRDEVLAPGLYARFAKDGRYVLLDKGYLALELQKRFSVDTVVQSHNGSTCFIEEKIVRWPGYAYDCYALETHSCTVPGHESEGWMTYGQADLLNWCFVQENGDVLSHIIDFKKLKDWFWPRALTFDTFGPLKTLNGSMGRKVPIAAVEREIGINSVYVHAIKEPAL